MTISWSIASVGPQRAGMSMSWTGIAMFAALAIGAPFGMALYQAYGLEVAMSACIVALPIPTKPPVCNGMIAPRDSWMMPPPCNEMIPPGAPRLLA